MTQALSLPDHVDLLRRIERDRVDGYEEQLELEIEDRDVPADTDADADRSARQRCS